MQVLWSEELNYRALDQWTREIPIIAKRGVITDCNGVVLVTNDDTYSVFVRKSAVKDVKELSLFLSSSLGLEYDYVYNRLTSTTSSEVTIKKQVQITY